MCIMYILAHTPPLSAELRKRVPQENSEYEHIYIYTYI